MKKIAIFTNSLRGGGAERIVSYLLNEGHHDYEFHVVLLNKEIQYRLPKSENIIIKQLASCTNSKYIGVFKIPFLSRKLKKYLVDNNIDTMISLLNRPNIISCLIKKSGWEGKVIISERVDTIAYYNSLPFGFVMLGLVRRYYPYADAVTVISKGIADSLKLLGINQCKLIYNPIYITPHHANELVGSTFTFISIGRLEHQKNHALLLKAFSELKDRDCKLVIVGKGRLQGYLEKLADSLQIRENVSFMGYQPNIESFLENSHCFVFSSDYEGFGNVIVEAMNAGVPVISTDCPYGPREILAPDTERNNLLENSLEFAKFGVLTPVGSISHLADAMRKMMDDKILLKEYSKQSLKRASDFDVKKISKQYFELF